MNDTKTTLQELKTLVKNMVDKREWSQFHSPKNLACNISIEANELLEKFVWIDSKESYAEMDNNRQDIQDELADIIIASICFANGNNIDLTQAITHKLEEIKKKYPVELSKGKKDKYTAYKKIKDNS
jgi:NTP pyrophosphatase (non-canonical NTP hydrolase)